MSTITIPLADDLLARLREEATRQGISPEELAGRLVDERLARTRDFRASAEYVLRKNAELYERLAR